jgi:'Cold-shock' DNA-binding domain
MNMGVINLIVCAHDARDAAHRLTVPVSGGRRRARIWSGGARSLQDSQRVAYTVTRGAKGPQAEHG